MMSWLTRMPPLVPNRTNSSIVSTLLSAMRIHTKAFQCTCAGPPPHPLNCQQHQPFTSPQSVQQHGMHVRILAHLISTSDRFVCSPGTSKTCAGSAGEHQLRRVVVLAGESRCDGSHVCAAQGRVAVLHRHCKCHRPQRGLTQRRAQRDLPVCRGRICPAGVARRHITAVQLDAVPHHNTHMS